MHHDIRILALALMLALSLSAACSGHDHENNGHTHQGDAGPNNGHTHQNNGHTVEQNNGDAHDASDAASHDHDADQDGADTSGQSSEASEAVVAYCDCAFLRCHTQYHERWGTDDLEARDNCLAEMQGIPEAGTPVQSGNFLECWQYYCDQVTDHEDPDQCSLALGAACSDM